MQTQVALIRGINIGTAKRVPMAELRLLVEELGYKDVRTLLNSGNVVFSGSPKNKGGAATQIQAALARKVGVAAQVMTVSAEHFNLAVAENPLAGIATDPARLLVAFVNDPADLVKLAPLAKELVLPEVMALGSRNAYLWCANGSLAGKLFPGVNRLLRDRVTTRNWATVLKLHAMVQG